MLLCLRAVSIDKDRKERVAGCKTISRLGGDSRRTRHFTVFVEASCRGCNEPVIHVVSGLFLVASADCREVGPAL